MTKKIKHRKVGTSLDLGLPPEDRPPKSPNGDDINMKKTPDTTPSHKWANVTAEDIGAGFVPLSDDEFERDVGIRPRFEFKTRKFKNRFVFGRSRFISYQPKTEFVSKTQKAKAQPINSNSRVTKPQRRGFARDLDKNIGTVVGMFMNEVLPATLSVQTAADEIKDRMSQLIDDPVSIPVDYYRAKLYLAAQMRITRLVCDQLALSAEEKALMFSDFQPKVIQAK